MVEKRVIIDAVAVNSSVASVNICSISQTKYAHFMSYENMISICPIHVILSDFKYGPHVSYLEVLFLPISWNRYGYMERQK